MSRVAKRPIPIPAGVEVRVEGQEVRIKGAKGNMSHRVPAPVSVTLEQGCLRVATPDGSRRARMLAGTTRALLNNMVKGVSAGFERRLEINGVGYRAQVQGRTLNLVLGYSHSLDFPIPEGIAVETPSQTEIVVRGCDRQQVGQAAADIRALRPPEPYKGKGVKYVGEVILRKEAKKT